MVKTANLKMTIYNLGYLEVSCYPILTVFLSFSADCYIDAHYIELDNGDVTSAAKDLVDALKIALLSGDWAKCTK